MSHVVFWREQVVVNTDPQRRCYDGAHFSWRKEWTEWRRVCAYETKESAEAAVVTFKSINPHRECEVRNG